MGEREDLSEEMNFINNLSAYQIRIEMAELGWNSEDRITDMGWGDKHGYSIWFERWDWHGKRTDRVCFHEHRAELSKIEDAVKVAAKRALRAWSEFTESVLKGG